MKIIVKKKNLENILDKLNPAIDSVNAFPALLGLYFDISESKITIIASNGDISIKHWVIKNENFKIVEPGILLIPSYLFKNIVKKLNGEIILSSENNILYIHNEDNIYTINCLESENYPRIDFEVLNNNEFKIPTQIIKNIIRNVSFSVATNNLNLILNGVNLSLKNKKLIATATDSFRLSHESFDIDSNHEFNISISAKNLRDLFLNILSKEISLYIDEYKLNIIEENTTFQVKLINVPYLNIENVIPKNYQKKLIIKKNILNDYLNKASVVLNEKYNAINFEISNKEILISSSRNEIGTTKLIIKNNLYLYNGENLKIRLNNKFLKDAINVFNDELVILFDTSFKPVLITSESNKNNLQLVSPLRIN